MVQAKARRATIEEGLWSDRQEVSCHKRLLVAVLWAHRRQKNEPAGI
jgi:hypothetical protein